MSNRRQHDRYHVAVAAELELSGQLFEGETRDVSAGGVSLLLSDHVSEELATQGPTELTLILTQDGIEDPNEPPFATKAEVMWCAEADGGGSMLGLRFGKLGPGEQKQLARFLAALAEQ
jgi:c-di-GMP-binding flagellar brake protein YcgR